MADRKPFLQGIFDQSAEEEALLPGQQPVKAAPPAPAAPLSAPTGRAAPTKADVVNRALDLGVDPSLALSFFRTESSGNFNSKDSPKGAIGGFQVMPDTYAQVMGTRDGMRDPWNNMEAGLRYIAHGQKVLGTTDPVLLAAGYHAGYGRPELKRGEIPDTNDGIMSTRAYAQKVAGGARQSAAPQYVPLTEAEINELTTAGRIQPAYLPLSDDEVAKLKLPSLATASATPAEQGFFDRAGAAVTEGWDSTMQNLSTARFALGGGDSAEVAQELAAKFARQAAAPKTSGQKEIDEAFQRVTDAKGAWDTTVAGFKAVGTALSNPKDLAVEIAGQAPNMVPTLGGAAVGAGAGAATGAGVGALAAGVGALPGAVTGGVLGGRAGMAVGTTATELGAEVEQMVSERLKADNKAPTPENIKALLDSKDFRSQARNQGLAKGLTVAAVDQLFLGLGGKVASSATRATSAAGKVGLGAAAVGTDAAGEVIGEAASQQVARGKVDAGDALREGVMSLGQSVVEPAAGAAMQGARRAAGRPADVTPAAEPAATTPVSPVQTAPVSTPSTAPGMMMRAVEDAAEQHAGQPNRVTVTTPDGQQASGQVAAYQEDADGNFVAQVVGDNGEVVTLDSRTGVQLTPEAAPEAGPMSAALAAAADDHAAALPAPTTETAAPVASAAQEVPTLAPDAIDAAVEKVAAERPRSLPEQLSGMELPALQERLAYIADQAKASGGWTKMFVDARNAVQREIRKREKESSNAQVRGSDAVAVEKLVDAGNAGRVAPAAKAKRNQPAGRTRNAQLVVEQQANPAAPVPAAGPAVPGEGEAAVEQPALTGFTSELDARQALAKQKLGKTHQVIERAPGQFELAPKVKQQPTRKADKLAAAEAKASKQEAAIAAAVDAAEKRHSAKADELYKAAVDVVRTSQRASVSLVQRHLKVGYNTAEAMMQRMERDGIVSPMASNGARTIIDLTAVPTQGATNEEIQAVPTKQEAKQADQASQGADVLTPKQQFDAIMDKAVEDAAAERAAREEKPKAKQEPRRKKAKSEPRYSVSDDTDDRDLVITHNLTEANLQHAAKMGGIAVPSLAVTRKDAPLTNFGDITLIGSKSMADPKGYAKTQVFGADIYSPRYPSVERDIDRKASATLDKKFRPMAEKMGIGLPGTSELERDGQREMERSMAVMGTFLAEQGIDPTIVMREGALDEKRVARLKKFGLGPYMEKTSLFDLTGDPEFVRLAADEAIDAYRQTGDERLVKRGDRLAQDAEAQRNIARDLAYKITSDAKQRQRPEADKYQTQAAMEKQIADADLSKQFQKYVADELAKVTKSERIFQGFTNRGNRKYTPHTLENVVKILKKELRGGENFNYGVGSLRAHFTPQFKSIAQIKKEKGRLVSKDAFDQVKKDIDAEFDAVSEAMGNPRSETVIAILEDAPKMGLERAAKQYGIELTDNAKLKSAEFLTHLHHLPTEYFEAKILRDVHMSEFSGAVVPKGTSQETIDILKSMGLPVAEYTNEEDRAKAVQSFAEQLDREKGGILFSVADDRVPEAIDQLMQDKAGEITVNVPGLGEVTIPYGDSKSGLAHIAKRRGADFIARLPDLLANGKVYEKGNQKGRVFIGNDRDEAVVSLTRDGENNTWLLSAYERYPDLKESRRSEVTEDRMPEGKFFTKDDLRKSLTSNGVLGQVIASMIDSGIIVLHGGPTKLPGGTGRRVKGVQAVTMPDGTIHMVASNLTPRTAMPVLLHEMFHQGGEKLIGTKEWGNLMGRLGSLYRQSDQSSGKAREFYDRARARVEAARKKGAVGRAMEVEEFAAYAVEEYEKDPRSLPAAIRKWVEDLLGLVKTWMVKNYGKQIGAVTPAQLAAMARWALMDVAVARRGEMFGPLGEVFSADAAPQTSDPVTLYYSRNTESAAKNAASFGDVGMDLEPSGEYMNVDHAELKAPGDKWEVGAIRFNNPLVLEHKDTTSKGWKKDLSDMFGGKTGKALSAAIKKAGYDGIITHDKYGLSETVNLSGEKFASMEEAEAAGPRFSVADDNDTATTSAPPPVREGLTPPEQGRLRRLQAAVQDNMNRVKQVQERIMDLTGRTTLGKADYYGAETNRPGRIAARLEDFREGMFQPLIEKLAKAGYKLEQLQELLHAQHAKERNEAVARINPEHDPASGDYTGTQGSGMNDDAAEAILQNYADQPKLLALAQEARDIARATLDLKLAYGLIKPEDHELLTTMYKHYIPLKGDGEYGPKIKRATGHGEREEHILENIARDYEQATIAGEKNLARQALLQMVLKFADDDLWTARVPPRGKYVAGKSYSVERNGKSEATFQSLSQVNAFLEAKGAEAANYTVLDNAGERVVEFTKPLQDNEVIVYVNGDPVRLQIHDEALARQLRPLGPAQMNPILEKMRDLNRCLSKIYTGYNPAFIFKNAARDAMTGTINMAGNQGAAVAAKAWGKYPSATKAMFQWAKNKNVPDGKMGAYLNEYRMHGGKTGASYMSDLEQQGQSLQAMFDDARGLAATAKDAGAKRTAALAFRKSVGKLAHVVEIANQTTENALRLALYAALREEGQSPAKAAQAAKTVTVDFDRKGELTGALGAIYLFFNPAVQGTANAMKTLFKGEHRKQAWAALGGLAMLGALAASQGMDEDKDRWLGESWENRTKSFKMNFGGHQFNLPLSQEFAPAYALGVAISEALHGEKPMRSAAHVLTSFLDAYFPLDVAPKNGGDNPLADAAQGVTPTVFKPIAEAAMNRNSFGSQVVPETELTKDRPDNLKMYRGTKGTTYDTAAQFLAGAGEYVGYAGRYENDLTKVSPETLKSLWRTYTGGLGSFVTDSIGAGRTLATGDVGSSDIPVLKDFWREQDVKPLRGRYYDLAREAKQAITEFKQAKKAQDYDEMDRIEADPGKSQLVRLGRMIDATTRQAAELADEKADVNQSSLPLADKRAKLKEIEQRETALYREAIDAFK